MSCVFWFLFGLIGAVLVAALVTLKPIAVSPLFLLLAGILVLAVVVVIRLVRIGSQRGASRLENGAFTVLSIVLIGLIALFGASMMQARSAETVWVAVKPLTVGQTVQESDVVAQRRPSQRKIDECAETGTPTGSPTPAATPISDGTAAGTSTPTTISTPTATPDPSAPTATPVLTPTTESNALDAFKTPIPASDVVVGRQVVQAVPRGCPVTIDHVETLVKLVVPSEKIFANGTPISRDVLEERELLAKDVPPKALTGIVDVTGKIANVDLTAGRPITIGQVTKPTTTPLASITVAVAKSDLGAYHELTDTNVSTTSHNLPATDVVTNTSELIGKLLLAAVAEGDPILESNVVSIPSEVKTPLQVFAVTAHGPTGLHSQLKPGDLVDIYMSPRVITDSEGVPHILTPAETLTSPSLGSALVLASKAGTNGSYEVTLAVGDSQSDNLPRLLALANQVDFTLVRRPQ